MKKYILITLSLLLSNINAANMPKSCHNPLVGLSTSMGEIDLLLDSNKAPITVKNFLDYVNKGFYNKKIFHRVIPGFMIQGGGFDMNMQQAKTNAPIQNEADNGLKNDKYTIAMARTSDPNSATAQFFINVNDNSPLNFTSKTDEGWGYAVFGKVIKGNEVVDKIAMVKTHNVGEYGDVPDTPVIINSVKILKCSK